MRSRTRLVLVGALAALVPVAHGDDPPPRDLAGIAQAVLEKVTAAAKLYDDRVTAENYKAWTSAAQDFEDACIKATNTLDEKLLFAAVEAGPDAPGSAAAIETLTSLTRVTWQFRMATERAKMHPDADVRSAAWADVR